jgi:uncharacterized protein
MRIHATGKPIDVEPYLDDLRKYLEAQAGLVAAWIFGSYGTPSQTPLSDLDLALLFRPDRLPDGRERLRLQAEISEILHEEDVSIMVLNQAPVILRFRVIESGRRLVCRDPVALADFVETVISRHADFIIDHERFAEEYDRALVERYAYDR